MASFPILQLIPPFCELILFYLFVDILQARTSDEEMERILAYSQRNFVCGVCGKKFRTRWHLETHERIHTGARPFACEVCGRTFNVKGNLKAHMFTHFKG